MVDRVPGREQKAPEESAERSRPSPAQMWENLCLAEELLEECEALAEAVARRTVEMAGEERNG